MQIGIGLPDSVHGAEGPLFEHGPRRAEERGFSSLATIRRAAAIGSTRRVGDGAGRRYQRRGRPRHRRRARLRPVVGSRRMPVVRPGPGPISMTSSATRSIHGRRSVSSVRAQSGLARKARCVLISRAPTPLLPVAGHEGRPRGSWSYLVGSLVWLGWDLVALVYRLGDRPGVAEPVMDFDSGGGCGHR
jgi:hypothetical protein